MHHEACRSKATFLIPSSVNSAAWRGNPVTVKQNCIHRPLYYQREGAPLLFWGYSVTPCMMLVLTRSETLRLFLLKVSLPFFQCFLIASFLSQSAQHMCPLSAASCIVIMTSPSCQLRFSPEQLLWINCGLCLNLKEPQPGGSLNNEDQ